MASSSSSSTTPNVAEVGVPVRLLMDLVDKTVTVDTATGEEFTGTLAIAEDKMNVMLHNVKAVLASGYKMDMNSVYLKSAKIRYIKLPNEAKDRCEHLNRISRPPPRGRGGRGGRGRGGGRGGGGRFGGGDRRRY